MTATTKDSRHRLGSEEIWSERVAVVPRRRHATFARLAGRNAGGSSLGLAQNVLIRVLSLRQSGVDGPELA